MTTKFPCGHDSLTSEYCANCNNAYHLGQHIRHALKSDNDRLLRALAEAKRETAHAHGLLDVNARALSQAVRRAAQFGAEDMRERAAEWLEALQQQDPWMNYDPARKALNSGAAGIRALPLLGKVVRRG